MGKAFFIADAHLGSKIVEDARLHEKKVVQLLDHLEKEGATAIYLLGDMFDFWFEYKRVIPKGFTRFLGKLAELSDKGIDIHFFIGNHDIWTFGYLAKEIGMKVHYKEEVVDINNKRCFLAHGDGIYTTDKKFKFIRSIFHSRFCQKLFAALPSSWGIGFGLKWSASNRKIQLQHTNEYLGENKEWLVQFAKSHEEKEHIDYYIFGHRHILLDLMIKSGSRVCILGDCIHMFSYACIDEKGELSLHTLEDELNME